VTYVLDACAMLALINSEPGADIVKRLFEEAERGSSTLSMSIVQLLEVYYDQIYAFGIDEAKRITEWIIASPVSVIGTITVPVMYEAGRLKTAYSISLADSVACAAALALRAVLVTSDHKEIEAVESGENLSILWLPPRPKK
jgi:predicted nucleic acid-binding protein